MPAFGSCAAVAAAPRVRERRPLPGPETSDHADVVALRPPARPSSCTAPWSDSGFVGRLTAWSGPALTTGAVFAG